MRRLALAVLLAASTSAHAAFQEDVGGEGAQFLKIGAGARALGMGEAMTACAEGPEAVYWNPAGLAATQSTEFAYTRSELPAAVHHDYTALALPASICGPTWLWLANCCSVRAMPC